METPCQTGKDCGLCTLFNAEQFLSGATELQALPSEPRARLFITFKNFGFQRDLRLQPRQDKHAGAPRRRSMRVAGLPVKVMIPSTKDNPITFDDESPVPGEAAGGSPPAVPSAPTPSTEVEERVNPAPPLSPPSFPPTSFSAHQVFADFSF